MDKIKNPSLLGGKKARGRELSRYWSDNLTGRRYRAEIWIGRHTVSVFSHGTIWHLSPLVYILVIRAEIGLCAMWIKGSRGSDPLIFIMMNPFVDSSNRYTACCSSTVCHVNRNVVDVKWRIVVLTCDKEEMPWMVTVTAQRCQDALYSLLHLWYTSHRY